MLQLHKGPLPGQVQVPRLVGLTMRVGAQMSVAIGQAG